MQDKERRKHLAEFLRARRKRLKPEDVGLPSGNRRRTPGLRREEVAQLAHIGTSWYTSLEQGREVHPSEDVLENIAKALRLNTAERQHLFLLVKQPLLCSLTTKEELNPALEAWIQTLEGQPAYIIGRRWDFLTWNQAADQIFQLSKEIPPHSTNYLWRFFHHQDLQGSRDWDQVARRLVAQFRADCARYPRDPWFEELIHDLSESSHHFRQWWERYDVQGAYEGEKLIDHPTLGTLTFEQITFQVATNPDLRVMILSPLDKSE